VSPRVPTELEVQSIPDKATGIAKESRVATSVAEESVALTEKESDVKKEAEVDKDAPIEGEQVQNARAK